MMMSVITGNYECKCCQGRDFTLVEVRIKGSYGMTAGLRPRCKKCEKTFSIEPCNTHGLTLVENKG
jgi:hypothetical protein